MAITRIKEFTINLGEIVRARTDSFVISRETIRAGVEADFQRRVVDEGLSWQDQLDFRKQQIEEEKEKTYPDSNFIEELKTSVSGFRKLVRARRFRDKYFASLQEMIGGKKSLDEHLELLDSELEQTVDIDLRDQINDGISSAKTKIKERDRNIIDSQIDFYEKDTTAESLEKAIDLVKKQINKIGIRKSPELLNAYKLQLDSLNKSKTEIEVEDRMNWMAVSLSKVQMKNPSLWKLEALAGFRDKASADMPVNVDGVNFNSEREFWESTLNSYIVGGFAEEYSKEINRDATLFWNKTGKITDSYLQTIVSKNNFLKSHSDLVNYPQVLNIALQSTISKVLDLKSNDLVSTYYLDKPALVTTSGIKNAKQSIENLKVLFGEDYSLSPSLQSLETMIMERTYNLAGKISETAESYAAEHGISIEEAIDIVGPASEVEFPSELYKEKSPAEAAKEEIRIGKEAVEKKTPAVAAVPEKLATPTTQEEMEERLKTHIWEPSTKTWKPKAATVPKVSPAKPEPAVEPEIEEEEPKFGAEVGFPQNQEEMERYKIENVWDPSTQKWYKKL